MARTKKCSKCGSTGFNLLGECNICNLLQTGETAKSNGTTTWPMKSLSLKVHKKQIAEATEVAKKKGVPTEFDQTGCPVFTSAKHFKDYAKAHGFCHLGYP